MNDLPDPSLLTPGFNNFLGPDLVMTSWASLGLNGLRFFEDKKGHESGFSREKGEAKAVPAGDIAWSCVEAVRFPDAAFDGLCIILPSLVDSGSTRIGGGLEVVVGLREESMGRLLSGDSGVWKYAETSVE